MEKIYQTTDVYTALQSRLDYIFAEFDNIYVSFSGGKESGMLYQLVLRYMEEHHIDRPIGLFHQDFEAQYTLTSDFVDRTFASVPDFADRFWVCLPMESKSCLSSYSTSWVPWEPGKDWVRPMPDYPYIINLDHNPLDYYQYAMPQESLYRQFGRWYRDHCGGGKTVALIGIRANESLHRYNAIINKKRSYKDQKWLTQNYSDVWTAAPLYDWTVEDVWTAIGKYDLDYNRLYDLYWQAGIPLRDMRVASPFNEWAIASLKTYRIIEPDAWAKMVRRVPGANFGAIYGDTQAMGYKDITLPPGHTWESYGKYLLGTLPDGSQINLHKRKDTDWKRLCVAILKNDHTGRTLAGKKRSKKQDDLKGKYAALIRGGKHESGL